VNWLVDPDAVAAEYASEQALRERVLAHRELVEGLDDEVIVRARVMAARPRRVVEVGSGLGDFCAWASATLEGEVVAVDASPRMVELAAQPGVEAVVADMRQLPFADAAFDCVVANFVLYHVPDPAIAIAEFARVLQPGGILLTSTLSDDGDSRLQAWATLFQEEKQPAPPPLSFSRENGYALLLRRFRHVEQTDCDAVLVFPTRERLARYIEAVPRMKGAASLLPELAEPFRLPDRTTVFQASGPR
jgi:ubiquinone/menaquinone biosynthesis C-methylase UbiE